MRLAQETGTRAVADMAQRFGITTRIDTNPSMALGSSSVRLIDMTRAYAAVGRGGVAVTPYGVRRVTTADGTLLYQHQPEEPRVLVAPWVAAQMTDLLAIGGRATAPAAPRTSAGRPRARPARPRRTRTPGSSAFRAGSPPASGWAATTIARFRASPAAARPARAFHDYMMRAVANRPVENFATAVQTPDWQMEPDNGIWFAPADGESPVDEDVFVDEDGNPVERPPAPAPPQDRKPIADDAVPRDEEEVELEQLDRELRERSLDRPRRRRRDEDRPRRGDPFET